MAVAGKPSPGLLLPLALLCTGTSLALYAQVITNKHALHPSSQLLAWTKYAVNFLTSAITVSTATTLSSPQHKGGSGMHVFSSGRWCALLGVLDVIGYGLNCLGFPLCGSALTTVVFAAAGQIFTALTRVTLLGRRMSDRQQSAVAVVVLGLVVRGAPWKLLDSKTPSHSSTGQIWLGVAYLVGSALAYSFLGVCYEKLFQRKDHALSHTEVNLRMSCVGLLALSLYQLLYTWPHRQRLVLQPMAAAGISAQEVVVLLAGFGGLFTVHSYVQGRVLEHSGAMTVGIINALRAATVTAASAVLFCSPSAPHQCLSLEGAASALIISSGVLLWSTAPAGTSAKSSGNDQKKQD